MNTNHTPHDLLDAAEAALRELPPEIVPSAATLNRIANLAKNAEAQSLPTKAASSIVRRWHRVAALLVTTAALIAVVIGVMYSPQTSFAFEDVIAAVRKADTLSYTTVITPKNGPASETKTYHKGSLTHTVYADGSYSVMDMAGQKMLMVQPALKTAYLTHLGSKPENLPTMGDSIIGWLKTAETTGKAVGEKTIHGVRTLGFECAFGATTMTLWGDPKSKLPVQIEATIGSPSEPIHMVMREFDFNSAVDDEDALFSTEVPAGFQTQETKQPAIDYAALAKLPPEEHVVRILKFYAKLHDGAFPERIDGPELLAKISSRYACDTLFFEDFERIRRQIEATASARFRRDLNAIHKTMHNLAELQRDVPGIEILGQPFEPCRRPGAEFAFVIARTRLLRHVATLRL